MSWLEAIILGIIQGITEFIPVSSSGHLVLADQLFGAGGGGLVFDVALHGGTLLALIIYFWHDVVRLVKALFIHSQETSLAWLLVIATLPAVLIGLLLEGLAEDTFRSSLLVSFNLIIVALLMLWAESRYERSKQHTNLHKTSRNQALAMGFAQALAIVPGVSRSGSTITAGLFSGMNRLAATRFSFLLGIPVIFGAFVKSVLLGDGLSQMQDEISIFVLGILAAFISGLFAINFLLKYVAKHSLKVFAYYRITLGIVVIIIGLII